MDHQKGFTSPDGDGSGVSTAGSGNVKGFTDGGVRGVGQIVEGVLISHSLAASAAEPGLACASSSSVHACLTGHTVLRKMHGYVSCSADILFSRKKAQSGRRRVL